MLTTVSVLSSTAAGGTGGGAYTQNAVNLTNGLFQGNSSHGSGGGLTTASNLTVTGTRFISNTSIDGNGGGAITGDVATLSNGLFQGNA